jgi:hypothetical protein
MLLFVLSFHLHLFFDFHLSIVAASCIMSSDARSRGTTVLISVGNNKATSKRQGFCADHAEAAE